MKKIINSLLSAIGHKQKELNSEVIAVTSNAIFTSADLWNIHRNGKARPVRRFL